MNASATGCAWVAVQLAGGDGVSGQRRSSFLGSCVVKVLDKVGHIVVVRVAFVTLGDRLGTSAVWPEQGKRRPSERVDAIREYVSGDFGQVIG